MVNLRLVPGIFQRDKSACFGLVLIAGSRAISKLPNNTEAQRDPDFIVFPLSVIAILPKDRAPQLATRIDDGPPGKYTIAARIAWPLNAGVQRASCKCGREPPARAGLARFRRDSSMSDRARGRARSIQTASRAKNTPQIRSAPNSCELWDARTALPQVCSRKTIRSAHGNVHSTFVPIPWHEQAIWRSQSRICRDPPTPPSTWPHASRPWTNRETSEDRGLSHQREAGSQRKLLNSQPAWLLP